MIASFLLCMFLGIAELGIGLDLIFHNHIAIGTLVIFLMLPTTELHKHLADYLENQ